VRAPEADSRIPRQTASSHSHASLRSESKAMRFDSIAPLTDCNRHSVALASSYHGRCRWKIYDSYGQSTGGRAKFLNLDVRNSAFDFFPAYLADYLSFAKTFFRAISSLLSSNIVTRLGLGQSQQHLHAISASHLNALPSRCQNSMGRIKPGNLPSAADRQQSHIKPSAIVREQIHHIPRITGKQLSSRDLARVLHTVS